MRLYFKPGACSLASRIVLTELGLAHESIAVDTQAGRTEGGADYRGINPKGYVPALDLGNGAVLTENPAILQYLADANPQAHLAPPAGTLERARLQEWLNFTSSELHKAFSPFFTGRKLTDDEQRRAHDALERRIGDVERSLSDGRSHALGDSFSVADAYLFVVLSWSNVIGVDLPRWPHVAAFVQRVAARPAVRAAMVREGLIAQAAA
jgi:glutathione S-transferase